MAPKPPKATIVKMKVPRTVCMSFFCRPIPPGTPVRNVNDFCEVPQEQKEMLEQTFAEWGWTLDWSYFNGKLSDDIVERLVEYTQKPVMELMAAQARRAARDVKEQRLRFLLVAKLMQRTRNKWTAELFVESRSGDGRLVSRTRQRHLLVTSDVM